MTTATQERKGLGTTTNHILNITQPLELNANLENNALTIYTGVNGSGKTFIMVDTYCLTMLSNYYIILKDHPQFNLNLMKEWAQQVYDKCYSEQNINGVLSMIYSSGAHVRVELDNGKVINVEFTGFEEVNVPTPVKFLSAHMRTFEAISGYLKIRRWIAGSLSDPNAIIEEMTKEYKLYDVTYLEEMIMKMPHTFTEETNKQLKEHFEYPNTVFEMGVDLEKDDFYIIQKKKDSEEMQTVYMKTLGKGHQSIFNMLMAHF